MKMLKFTIALFMTFSLGAHAAVKTQELTFSTPHMNLSEQKKQSVSLGELKRVLKQLSLSEGAESKVKTVLIEGVITSPPTRGMAQTNQGTRLKIKSNALNMEKMVTLKPDTYNRVEVDLAKAITSENDISDFIVESESSGMIGDLRLSFVIDY